MNDKLLVTKIGETMNAHILKIQAGITNDVFTNNALTKKKRVTRKMAGSYLSVLIPVLPKN